MHIDRSPIYGCWPGGEGWYYPSQRMWIDSIVIARQIEPIKFIDSEPKVS